MKITHASINEQGKRPYQEDTVGWGIAGERTIFAVADGLGGHGCGDLASKKVVEMALGELTANCEIEEYFSEVFHRGNTELCRLQEENQMLNSMKTTLAITIIEDRTIYGAYIGDSRIYIFEKGKITYQSLDHSVPQMLVSAGEIPPKKIRNHPDRNRLLKVLGDRERQIKPQIIPSYRMGRTAAILICTDGFWENVLESEMEKTLRKSENPEEWIDRMKKIAQKRGRHKNQDNFSAVCIWVSRS